MFSTYQIVSYLFIAGAISVGYVLRRAKGNAGAGFGLSFACAGLLTWADSNSLAPKTILVGLLFLVSEAGIVFAYFVIGRQLRIFLLGGAFLFPAVSFYLVPLPLVFLFAYAAISLAIVNSHDYSRVDITSCVKHANKVVRIVFWPLSFVEGRARGFKETAHPTFVLGSGYVTIQLAILLGIPIVLWQLSGRILQLEDMILVLMIILVWSGREVNKIMKGLGSEGDPGKRTGSK